jgi:mannitol/fructose-specific phosphotransferase system IIA component (Ntr-type)
MLIPPDHIIPELQATTRYPAIRELLQSLIQIGVIPPDAQESLFAAFRQREEVMSTGIGFGLAFPHITSEIVTKQIVALGRSRAGVDFSSIDGRPAREIYLMISPPVPKTSTDA